MSVERKFAFQPLRTGDGWPDRRNPHLIGKKGPSASAALCGLGGLPSLQLSRRTYPWGLD